MVHNTREFPSVGERGFAASSGNEMFIGLGLLLSITFLRSLMENEDSFYMNWFHRLWLLSFCKFIEAYASVTSPQAARLSMKDRNCYNDDENILKFYPSYSVIFQNNNLTIYSYKNRDCCI